MASLSPDGSKATPLPLAGGGGGVTEALVVLATVVVVQQVEGNALQPVLPSRSLGLHSAAVLLAVTDGSTLYGIAGAFLAVPVAASAAVIIRYLGERIDARAAPPSPGTDDVGVAEETWSQGYAPRHERSR